MENKFDKTCSYMQAIDSLRINFVLLNEITEIDEFIWDSFLTDYPEFCYDYEETEDHEIIELPEVYQWFITDADTWHVKFAKEHFSGVYFVYSEKLNKYMLAVTHYGTSWSYVPIDTDLDFK